MPRQIVRNTKQYLLSFGSKIVYSQKSRSKFFEKLLWYTDFLRKQHPFPNFTPFCFTKLMAWGEGWLAQFFYYTIWFAAFKKNILIGSYFSAYTQCRKILKSLVDLVPRSRFGGSRTKKGEGVGKGEEDILLPPPNHFLIL